MKLALWPAIDIRGGCVVRLLKGELSAETVYDARPEEAARRFEAEGADGIHVVDLDGAFARGENRGSIAAVLGAVRIPVQVGGGLRSGEDVERVLAEGAARAVLGSLPFTAPAVFAGLLARHGDRLVVALDCREGRPTVHGWTETAGAETGAGAAARLSALGVAALLVTDVARDGALTGPNLALLAEVRRGFEGEVLASGGMRGEEDLAPVDKALSGGPRGVVLGRALHGGLTTVAVLRAARDRDAVPAGGV